MNKFINIIILALTLLWTPSFADSLNNKDLEKNCFQLFKNLIRDVRGNFLTPDQENQILSIINNLTDDPKIKAKNVFDFIFQARLQMLPEIEAQKAYQAFTEIKTTVSPSGFKGEFSSTLNIIKTSIPQSLYETAVHYFVILHELEHSIQINHIASKLNLTPFEVRHFLSPIVDRYFLEDGAMRAEWQYLRRIPKSDRLLLLTALRKESHISAHQKKWVATVLISADLSQKDYLKNVRSLRGYAKDQLIIDLSKYEGEIFVNNLLPGIIAPVGLIIFLERCEHLKAKGRLPANFRCHT